jgi:HK97 family phage major capsid protein
MATKVKEPTLLDKLRSQRLGKLDAWAEITNARETERQQFEERQQADAFKALPEEARDREIQVFKDAEAAFKADSDQRKAAIEEMDDRIADQEAIRARRDEAAAASAGTSLSITSEPLTYRSDNARGSDSVSYYVDLALVHGPGITLQSRGTRDHAQARLVRHGQEMDVEMPKRAEARAKAAQAAFEQAELAFYASFKDQRKAEALMREMRGGLYSPFEMRVEPNMTQGQGGYFVPPTWLVDQFIPGLRAHRVVGNLPRQMPLPAGTNSINIPKLSTLTVVGYQQMNNSGLPSQDWTDTSVQANVKTVGGYSDVAVQLLEMSPHGIVDEVVTTDLMAAHDKFLDAEIIAGDGSNAATLNGGHLQGIYNGSGSSAWSGVNTVTYTEGTPVPAHMAPGVFGPMWSKIAANRFRAGDGNLKFVTHGSRWAYYSTGLDANNRPLGETLNGGPYNIQARVEQGLPAEGLVGFLPYLSDAPVYADDNIPTTDNTDGGGANRDVVIGGLWDDSWLFEDALRTDVFREVLSGSLGVRFRIYGYKAFLVRYGQSFAVCTGSGLAKPSTGYGDFFR